MLGNMNILPLQMICDEKLSGEPTSIAGLQNLKIACYVACAIIWERSRRIKNSFQLLCLGIAVRFILASIWFSTVKWSKQKVLTGGNISQGQLA